MTDNLNFRISKEAAERLQKSNNLIIKSIVKIGVSMAPAAKKVINAANELGALSKGINEKESNFSKVEPMRDFPTIQKGDVPGNQVTEKS